MLLAAHMQDVGTIMTSVSYSVKTWKLDYKELSISDIQCSLNQWIDTEVRDRR